MTLIHLIQNMTPLPHPLLIATATESKEPSVSVEETKRRYFLSEEEGEGEGGAQGELGGWERRPL